MTTSTWEEIEAEFEKRFSPCWNDEDAAFVRKYFEAAHATRLNDIRELEEEVNRILVDEIAIAHSTESGKTSRLTSAVNRINTLLAKKREEMEKEI